MTNYYHLLSLAPSATLAELQAAITTQSALWSKRASSAVSLERKHEAERVLASLGEARRVLLNPIARRAYDDTLTSTFELPATHKAETSSDGMHCPYCLEEIRPGAKKCRWCGEWLEARVESRVAGASADIAGQGNAAPERSSDAEDIVTLVDVDGVNHEFQVVDVVEVQGRDYALVIPAASDDPESEEVLVLRLEADRFEMIDDESEFQRVVRALEAYGENTEAK